MDISAIEEYLRIYRVNTRRKHGFEEVDLWSDALEPDLSELSILWKNVGAISYLLTNSKIEDDTEFTLEEMLSVHSIVDNDELGNLPSLAALAWQTTKAENSHRVASNMRMTLMLLNENADPNYISRVSCRSRYTVPDAISLAISSLCVPMFRTLLSYWWPSPVYLLDSPTGRQVKNFKFLFPIISKFGWPHGTRICSVVEHFIDNVIKFKLDKKDRAIWRSYKLQMRRAPSTLKQLSRIVVRNSIGSKAAGGHELYSAIQSLNVPTKLIDYLLLKEA